MKLTWNIRDETYVIQVTQNAAVRQCTTMVRVLSCLDVIVLDCRNGRFIIKAQSIWFLIKHGHFYSTYLSRTRYYQVRIHLSVNLVFTIVYMFTKLLNYFSMLITIFILYPLCMVQSFARPNDRNIRYFW